VGRKIRLRVLPGEPLNNMGKRLVHWFERAEDGTVRVPPFLMGAGLAVDGYAGRIACMPHLKDLSPKRDANGLEDVVVRHPNPRAANCPACLATEAYKLAIARLEAPAANTNQQGG
jgi:hypothetical protein